MNKVERQAFREFLVQERLRHSRNIWEAQQFVSFYEAKTEEGFAKAIVQFWRSAIKRHADDLAHIDKLMEEL